jgi:hypothetical protein
LYQIQQGLPSTSTPSVTLLPSGLAGDLGSLSRLVHPDDDNLPPVVYYKNPDRRSNFSTDVLKHPITKLVRTASSSKLIRFEEVTEDVVVTETWTPSGGLSLPLFMVHQIYEYLDNAPAFSATNQEYIVWEPRNETDDTYHVEIVDFFVGSTARKFNMKRYMSNGGPFDPFNPGSKMTPTDTMDVSPTALIDQQAVLIMRIVERS